MNDRNIQQPIKLTGAATTTMAEALAKETKPVDPWSIRTACPDGWDVPAKVKPTGIAKPETIAAAETAKLDRCCCGCGERVLSETKVFRMGHDAKLKSRLIRVNDGRLSASKLGISKAFATRVLQHGGFLAKAYETILKNVK